MPNQRILVALAGVALAGAVAAAAGALLFLTASPSEAPSAPLSARAEPDARPPVTPAEGSFAAIKASGELRVAADPAAPPFLSGSPGAWEGYEYGVMSALAASIGVPVRVVPTDFDGLAARLVAGEADLALSQVSPGTAWEGVAYTVSYLQYSLCLVTASGSPVEHLPALRGKRVGMWNDPTASMVANAGIGGEYTRVPYDAEGYFADLTAGRLDAVVYDCPLARHELAGFPTLRIRDDALSVATYNVAVRERDTTLLAEVDRVLRGLAEQELLARLEERWLGSRGPSGAQP